MDGPGLNVRRFGALGDRVTDDTAAIQRAIDAAGEVQGAVWFPPGHYACGTLRVRAHVALVGTPTWSYRRDGGTVLHLAGDTARCLLDLTGAVGAHVSGLALAGGRTGRDIHGIYFNGEGHKTEDTLVIENCRIAEFSGDGARLEQVWGFTVRGNLFHHNGGDGLMTSHWDGWVHDNIMIGNGKFGYAAREANASVTVTGNRIEWNGQGGMLLEHSANHYNITGNYFDRSGGPALLLPGNPADADPRWQPGTIAITGNIFNRSGAKAEAGTRDSCHLRLENTAGIACTGNTFCFGNNDDGTGQFSPSYAMVLKNLRHSVVAGNALHNAATRQLVLDEGGHDAATVIRDNPGCLAPPA